MPTNKPRFNITMEPEMADHLNKLAKKRSISASKLVQELVADALDRYEDMALSELADERETVTQKVVAHDDVWK
ncbi:MAG: CopG family transcriptional regulator [Candidatus Dependentiae bacterium]